MVMSGMTTRQIAERLSDSKFLSPSGSKKWHPSTVWRVIVNGEALETKTAEEEALNLPDWAK